MAITVSELALYTASGTSISTSKTLTAGSTVVVFGEAGSGGAPSLTMSDGVNTYTLRQSINDATTLKTWCWTAGNVAGGSTTFTLGGLGGFAGSILVYEFIGADAASNTSSYDNSDSIANSSSTSPIYAAQVGGITLASNTVAIALYRADRDISGLTASGWTAGTDSNRSTISYFYPRWKAFASGASGERAQATLGAATGYTTGILISIKEAAGGGSSSVPPNIITPNQGIAFASAARRSI